jgi:hypothetical protein
MNKIILQEIASKLQSTIKSSNPNQRYTELMKLVGELNGAINQLEDVIEIVKEEKTPKKKKTTKKKKPTTED